MKIILLCVLLSIVSGTPISDDAQARIMYNENHNDELGNYEFSFETSNGISRKETGRLVNIGEPNEHIEVEGEFSYTDPNGKLVQFRYTADENGYHIFESPSIVTVISAPETSPQLIATLLG